jgi:hypothetical protein
VHAAAGEWKAAVVGHEGRDTTEVACRHEGRHVKEWNTKAMIGRKEGNNDQWNVTARREEVAREEYGDIPNNGI